MDNADEQGQAALQGQLSLSQFEYERLRPRPVQHAAVHAAARDVSAAPTAALIGSAAAMTAGVKRARDDNGTTDELFDNLRDSKAIPLGKRLSSSEVANRPLLFDLHVGLWRSLPPTSRSLLSTPDSASSVQLQSFTAICIVLGTVQPRMIFTRAGEKAISSVLLADQSRQYVKLTLWEHKSVWADSSISHVQVGDILLLSGLSASIWEGSLDLKATYNSAAAVLAQAGTALQHPRELQQSTAASGGSSSSSTVVYSPVLRPYLSWLCGTVEGRASVQALQQWAIRTYPHSYPGHASAVDAGSAAGANVGHGALHALQSAAAPHVGAQAVAGAAGTSGTGGPRSATGAVFDTASSAPHARQASVPSLSGPIIISTEQLAGHVSGNLSGQRAGPTAMAHVGRLAGATATAAHTAAGQGHAAGLGLSQLPLSQSSQRTSDGRGLLALLCRVLSVNEVPGPEGLYNVLVPAATAARLGANAGAGTATGTAAPSTLVPVSVRRAHVLCAPLASQSSPVTVVLWCYASGPAKSGAVSRPSTFVVNAAAPNKGPASGQALSSYHALLARLQRCAAGGHAVAITRLLPGRSPLALLTGPGAGAGAGGRGAGMPIGSDTVIDSLVLNTSPSTWTLRLPGVRSVPDKWLGTAAGRRLATALAGGQGAGRNAGAAAGIGNDSMAVSMTQARLPSQIPPALAHLGAQAQGPFSVAQDQGSLASGTLLPPSAFDNAAGQPGSMVLSHPSICVVESSSIQRALADGRAQVTDVNQAVLIIAPAMITALAIPSIRCGMVLAEGKGTTGSAVLQSMGVSQATSQGLDPVAVPLGQGWSLPSAPGLATWIRCVCSRCGSVVLRLEELTGAHGPHSSPARPAAGSGPLVTSEAGTGVPHGASKEPIETAAAQPMPIVACKRCLSPEALLRQPLFPSEVVAGAGTGSAAGARASGAAVGPQHDASDGSEPALLWQFRDVYLRLTAPGPAGVFVGHGHAHAHVPDQHSQGQASHTDGLWVRVPSSVLCSAILQAEDTGLTPEALMEAFVDGSTAAVRGAGHGQHIDGQMGAGAAGHVGSAAPARAASSHGATHPEPQAPGMVRNVLDLLVSLLHPCNEPVTVHVTAQASALFGHEELGALPGPAGRAGGTGAAGDDEEDEGDDLADAGDVDETGVAPSGGLPWQASGSGVPASSGLGLTQAAPQSSRRHGLCLMDAAFD